MKTRRLLNATVGAWITLIDFCGLSLTLAQQGAQSLAALKIKVEKGITYAKIKEKELKLDIYSPEDSKEPAPLIVWIHGGAWRAGNRNNPRRARQFVPKGYVFATISYRFSQEAIFPAQIQDCKGAIRFLRANTKKYGIDPKRVGVWGASAGGHLVALLGTSGDVKDLEGEVGGNLDQSSRVQAVCDFFGPTDFLQMSAHPSRMNHDSPNSPESQLIGGAIQENPEKVARANPITYVTKDDPPTFIVHGDKDPLVPHHQSQIFYEALKKAGVDAKLQIVKGAGHGFPGRPDVYEAVEKFFDRVLMKK